MGLDIFFVELAKVKEGHFTCYNTIITLRMNATHYYYMQEGPSQNMAFSGTMLLLYYEPFLYELCDICKNSSTYIANHQ